MAELDNFTLNLEGPINLMESDTNKVLQAGNQEEVGELMDYLELPMSNEELRLLKDQWLMKWDAYGPKITPRQQQNRLYYVGAQKLSGISKGKTVPSNLIFEAEETFIPQALSKNPDPVVFSDDTPEGKEASSDLQTMLQYYADTMVLRKKLAVMLRHWSIYLLGIIKHGWDAKSNNFTSEVRKPQNFIFDPDGYIDEFGDFKGEFLGEKIHTNAKKLIDMFPKSKDYIMIKVDGKLGTPVTYTEWWTDEYCFSTFQDEVLDKHKNEFFDYENEEQNHFATPKMPYTFLSVFSLQEHPFDETNLIEQSISNQDMINDRDWQISRNLRASNNSIALSGTSFDKETARQAANALEDGDPVLVPDGQVQNAIKRLEMPGVADAVFKAQENAKETLKSIFGTYGISAVPQNSDTTARGMILNQSHDSTRIGGGVGDALEQVADNIFNWWVQLMSVFFDETHYGGVLGQGKAISFVALTNQKLMRNFVVSVTPNSMKPKDEISKINMAIQRWNNEAIDPLSFMKEMEVSNPQEEAQKLTLWITNKPLYTQIYFPEIATGMEQGGGNPPNAPGVPNAPPTTLASAPASASLSNVPINTQALPK